MKNTDLNQVDICYKDLCVTTKGKNAIASAIVITLTCVGISLLVNARNNQKAL